MRALTKAGPNATPPNQPLRTLPQGTAAQDKLTGTLSPPDLMRALMDRGASPLSPNFPSSHCCKDNETTNPFPAGIVAEVVAEIVEP